jgi:hypothetical protein
MHIVASPPSEASRAPQSARDLPVNPHQPPGWQQTQVAAILALAAASAPLVKCGMEIDEANAVAVAVVRTFLQNMAMSRKPMATASTLHETVEDFLRAGGRS